MNTQVKVCDLCDGTGEVRTMAQVWAGEPHMADIGTAPCPECRVSRSRDEDDDYSPDD